MSSLDNMEDLSTLERSILHLSFEGDGLDLFELRNQLDIVKVDRRENTGAGLFIDLKIPPSYTPKRYLGRMQLSNVHGTCKELNEGFGVTVFVEDGLLKLLELYSFDENWPEQLTDVKLSRF